MLTHQVITVVRPVLKTDHGAMIPDWSDTVDHQVTDCSIQPGAFADSTDRRDGVVIAYSVWAPPGADVVATDGIRLADGLFVIIGEPGRWASPTGRLDHIVLSLTRTEG